MSLDNVMISIHIEERHSLNQKANIVKLGKSKSTRQPSSTIAMVQNQRIVRTKRKDDAMCVASQVTLQNIVDTRIRRKILQIWLLNCKKTW